jgi:hypothetical protein
MVVGICQDQQEVLDDALSGMDGIYRRCCGDYNRGLRIYGIMLL